MLSLCEMSDVKPSRSSEALGLVLDEDGAEAAALKNRIHFTLLYAYRGARTRPGLERAFEIQTLSNGRVPADGWLPDDCAQESA